MSPRISDDEWRKGFLEGVLTALSALDSTSDEYRNIVLACRGIGLANFAAEHPDYHDQAERIAAIVAGSIA